MRSGSTVVAAGWLALLLTYLTISVWIPGWSGVMAMSDGRRLELKEETRRLFKHGFEGYMEHAYPADELRSLTCTPLHRDPNPANVGVNDIHANVSMTLLDTLSSLPLIHPTAFPRALHLITSELSFDQDVKVQVFELTIRALGSLLSTYQQLEAFPPGIPLQAEKLGVEEEELGGVDVRLYMPRLLELALDLGKRLLPAFQTPTGLPYARVNLRHGVEKGESVETCTAGAGSLVLEFAVLSRLTGDDRFEALAHRAYVAMWNRRSPHNLLGNTIAVTHGQWLAPGMSTVGAGMDSYFEYGIKAAILLGDDMYLDIFQESYAALQTHVRADDGFIYRPIQFRSLQLSSPSLIDSLSAFLPGMQVLAGDIQSAIKSHLVFWNIWRKHSAIPESWDWQNRRVEWAGWPGRPEFIESTYYLYRATMDPFYLRVGERVLDDMKRRIMTECGFATMSNVDTGELDDRMESFVLSETLKYLYLLFDDSYDDISNKVFTTEGHTLSLPMAKLRRPTPTHRQMHRGENLVCPVYYPHILGGGIVVGIERRADYEYARSLVFGQGLAGRVIEDKERVGWWEGGFCEVPKVPKYSFEIVLAPLNTSGSDPAPPEDAAPSAEKVHQDEQTGHFWIHDIEGLRLGVRWRLDNQGYDISNIGPHRVRTGQHVIVTDPKMEGFLPVPSGPATPTHLPAEVVLRFSSSDSNIKTSGTPEVFLHAIAATATFGRDFGLSGNRAVSGMSIGGSSLKLVRPKSNSDGCNAFSRSDLEESKGEDRAGVFLLDRGDCTFFRKALNAKQAGAAGLIILGYDHGREGKDFVVQQSQAEMGMSQSDSTAANEQETGEGLIRPSAEEEPDYLVHRLGKDFGVVYVERKVVGEVLERLEHGMEVDVELVDMRGEETKARESDDRGDEREPRQTSECGDGDGDQSSTSTAAGRARGKNRQDWRREGRVMVAGWDIWNLRIVERPP